MRTTALCFLLILAGCAGRDLTAADFEPGARSAEAFRRDRLECEMKAEQNRYHAGAGGARGIIGLQAYHRSFNSVFRPCMQARGYRLRPDRTS